MKDKYLITLHKALTNVDIRYHSQYALHISGDQVTTLKDKELKKYKQSIERNFAYELYHQFRLLMDDTKNKDLFSELQLNGEITKVGFNDQVIGTKAIIPDLVLHYGQLDISPNFQRLFVEIKTDEKPKLKKDISKLVFAIRPPLNFRYSVMLCINSELEYLKNSIIKNELLVRLTPEELKKIYLFTPTYYCSFNKIINQNV